MLVGGAQRGQWRRSNGRAVRSFLAKALRPQLNEPVGEIAQWIRVGHEHSDRLSQLGVGDPLELRVHASWVGREISALAAPRHIGRASEKGFHVDAEEGGGKRPDGRKHAEPPADIRRNVQRWHSEALGQRTQRTLFWVGDKDHLLADVQLRRCNAIADDEKLRHRFRRSPRLRRDDEQRALEAKAT